VAVVSIWLLAKNGWSKRMRRIALVLGVAALLVVVFAAVALAVNKQCTGYPCFGTENADVLYERGGDGVGDRIYSKPGSDRVFVNSFEADRDIVFAGRGNDRVNADDGDTRDEVYGERGYDKCRVDARSEVESGCNEIYVNGTLQ
jgi:hypothetical protein